MILLEHESKSLLKKYNLPVAESTLIPANTTTQNQQPINPETTVSDVLKVNSDLNFPVVVKSQVPTGGRGKLGGIKLVKTPEELNAALVDISNLKIKNYTPKTILVEEALNIDRELYLSISINRSLEAIEILANPNGGVEVEENTPDSFLRLTLSGEPTLSQGEELADYYNLQSHSFALQDILKNLYQAFTQNDATLIEINPLILTKEGNLVAGDGKITLDDSAYFRHPDWNFETIIESSNFVTLNPNGQVATIANGAGLAMATVDAVEAHGLTPANFLDIGGGASADSVLEAFRKIVEYKGVKAIVINIFAGITKCDEVAKAIIAARSQIANLPPLYIRLAGTNYEAAAKVLQNEGIELQSTLNDCLALIKQGVQ